MRSIGKDEVIRTEVREKDGFEYKYRLTLSEGKEVASYGVPLYSVTVEMKAKSDERKTESNARDLFSDINKASGFFNRIVDNLATPIDLPYIVEDELSK